jgi:hypothetical protein
MLWDAVNVKSSIEMNENPVKQGVPSEFSMGWL